MTTIISKDEAKALGLRHFFTGKPCKRGGLAPRRVNGGRCTCDACRRHIAKRVEDYKAANPEKERARLREATRNRYWSGQRGKVMARAKAWMNANPHKRKAINARYRKAITERIPVWFAEFDELVSTEAFLLATARQAATGIAWHVDHMVPLRAETACGLHCGHNFQVIPGFLNTSKCNRMWLTAPDEWLLCL